MGNSSSNDHILTPPKTASRAIRRAIGSCQCTSAPQMHWHEALPSTVGTEESTYHIVLRDPVARVKSAFSFKKNAGENLDELLHPGSLYVRRFETLDELVQDRDFETGPLKGNLPLMQEQYRYSTYFDTDRHIEPIYMEQGLDEWWRTVREDWGCRDGCELQQSNVSNSSQVEIGPATQAWIDENLAEDVQIYEAFCG